MRELATYLYAVTAARPHSALPAGIGDAPVHVLGDDLFAVVSSVPLKDFDTEALRRNLENLDWLAAVARSHNHVVEAVDAAGPTAPLRICTIFHDEDRVLDLLDNKRAAFTDVLRRVSGHREWGVKVYSGGEPAGGTSQSQPVTESTTPGTTYLQRLQTRRRLRDDQADQGEQIHTRMQEISTASRRYPAQDQRLNKHPGRMLLNAAYLVENSAEQSFRERAYSFADAVVQVEVTGPWAPYSFVRLEEI